MADDSRMRMVHSAADLIGAHGVSATSFSEVLQHSGAPRGSIYHHFPGGKQQLAEEAIQWTSERILAYQRECLADTATGVLEHFIALWRQGMVASCGAAGCPVAGVALDTLVGDTPLIDAVRGAFRAWVALLAEQLAATGVPSERATPLALTVVASLEGALILCRAEGDSRPLNAVADELLRLVSL